MVPPGLCLLRDVYQCHLAVFTGGSVYIVFFTADLICGKEFDQIKGHIFWSGQSYCSVSKFIGILWLIAQNFCEPRTFRIQDHLKLIQLHPCGVLQPMSSLLQSSHCQAVLMNVHDLSRSNHDVSWFRCVDMCNYAYIYIYVCVCVCICIYIYMSLIQYTIVYLIIPVLYSYIYSISSWPWFSRPSLWWISWLELWSKWSARWPWPRGRVCRAGASPVERPATRWGYRLGSRLGYPYFRKPPQWW